MDGSLNLAELRDGVLAAAEEAGRYLLDERLRIDAQQIEVKEHGDYVSHADREAEALLVDRLTRLLPGSTVLAEEGHAQQSEGELRWIIDPLDGTANYLYGLPVWAVSVALEDRRGAARPFGELLVGVVHEPALGASYEAIAGGGARRNGQPLKVAETTTLERALVATAFPFREREKMEDYLSLFRSLYPRISDIRRLGSAAADLAWVAEGVYDGFFEMDLKPWDVAAGQLLVAEAGGRATDWWGQELRETGWVAAGSELFWQELTRLAREIGFERPAKWGD